jgi:hypothetical protein
MTQNAEESSIDAEIARLQEELIKLKVDEKNLKIALRVVEERIQIEDQYRQKK